MFNTLGAYAAELAEVAWVILWKSPVGDHYTNADFGGREGQNPTCTPGDETPGGGPWPDLSGLLVFDRKASFSRNDTVTNARSPLTGVFYLKKTGKCAFLPGGIPLRRYRWSRSGGAPAVAVSRSLTGDQR